MTLNSFLRELSVDNEPLKYSGLIQVSGLTSQETAEFKSAWPSIRQERRQEIVGKLVELCEQNLELDFNVVFVSCLADEDEVVREMAAQGLWDCDDRTVIRPFIDLLKDDPSPRVRTAASMLLGKFATMAQNGKLLPRDSDRIRDALMSIIELQDEDPEVRRRAIEAVASFDIPETADIIRNAYHSDDPKLMQSSLYAMGQSSNTQWLPHVLEEMDHEQASIRYEATTACGLLGDESTAPRLIRLLEDDDAQVQLAAVKALGAVGGQLAGRALHQCLKLGDEALMEAAEEALSNIEYDEDPLAVRFEV